MARFLHRLFHQAKPEIKHPFFLSPEECLRIEANMRSDEELTREYFAQLDKVKGQIERDSFNNALLAFKDLCSSPNGNLTPLQQTGLEYLALVKIMGNNTFDEEGRAIPQQISDENLSILTECLVSAGQLIRRPEVSSNLTNFMASIEKFSKTENKTWRNLMARKVQNIFDKFLILDYGARAIGKRIKRTPHELFSKRVQEQAWIENQNRMRGVLDSLNQRCTSTVELV